MSSYKLACENAECRGHSDSLQNYHSRNSTVAWKQLFLVTLILPCVLFQIVFDWKVYLENDCALQNDPMSTSYSTNKVPIRYPKIIGHLHMAKTAGTEINGELAAHYERVCGHKGYSYDAVKFNKRVYEYAKAHGGMATESNGGPDIISYKYKRYNRGRVPWSIMNEIGYEDCDFVSLEREWQSWKNVAAIWPVELHVPCRDPLEHLMSQCNYQDLQFNCTAIDLHHEVESCLLHPNRFSAKLLHVKNLTLRCFNPTPMEPYIAYIDRFLERKRIEVTYVHRNTNNARDRNDECIWKNQKVMDLVKEILSSFDYYRWCNHCIGSENELFSIN